MILFLPGEVFFRAAMDADHELLEYGASEGDRGVTDQLIAMMKTVAYGWHEKNLADNARQIGAAGKQLYERLCKMTGHVDILGRKLESAVKSYNEMLSSMEKRVFPAGRRVTELERSLSGNLMPDPEQIERTPRHLESPDWQSESLPDPLSLLSEDADPQSHKGLPRSCSYNATMRARNSNPRILRSPAAGIGSPKTIPALTERFPNRFNM